MTSPKVLGQFIEVRDGPLYADIREGNGPALVFLHYWGGSRRTWTPVLTRLDPGQAFVAYDQRGWGNSVDVPGPYDMEQLADDAQKVIDTLGYTDYVLIGHSMGGKVAQVLAARKPAGLAGVVLVAPAPPAPVGATAQLQELTSHAYDSAETVQQGIDMMLTNAGFPRSFETKLLKTACAPARRPAWPGRVRVWFRTSRRASAISTCQSWCSGVTTTWSNHRVCSPSTFCRASPRPP